MSPRPRKVSDDAVFLAAQRAMSVHGPLDLTLAHIAAEAGVTAGALVQRFGGKRELLLALSARFAGGTKEMFQALRAAHPSPLAALRAWALGMAHLAGSPEALARNLAWLHIDLTDTDFRVHVARQARAQRRELAALLQDAVRAGQLRRGTDPVRLARTVETMITGSLMTYACHQQGRAARWLAQDLEAILEPWLA